VGLVAATLAILGVLEVLVPLLQHYVVLVLLWAATVEMVTELLAVVAAGQVQCTAKAAPAGQF
jgi:hypothetical protein